MSMNSDSAHATAIAYLLSVLVDKAGIGTDMRVKLCLAVINEEDGAAERLEEMVERELRGGKARCTLCQNNPNSGYTRPEQRCDFDHGHDGDCSFGKLKCYKAVKGGFSTTYCRLDENHEGKCW